MTLLETLFFALYRLALWPLIRLAFSVLALFNEKVRKGIEMRAPNSNGIPPWLDSASGLKPIWIHCASGEFEYAKPVITRLKTLAPEKHILVTYFSPSIAAAAKKFPGVDFACPLPWETPRALKKFIAWHKPQALLIARTDTWPEMLRQAKRSGLPTLLFSATLPANSGRARGLGRLQSRITFRFLDHIMCVAEEDRLVFSGLGVGERTEVAGDTRYDQVQARLQAPKPLRDELFSPRDAAFKTLVAGSTWPEDETVLLEVAAALRARVRFVLVPHEPTQTHLAELEEKLQRLGLKSVRYSTAEAWPKDAVLLIDQIGILAELYLKGNYAFVGGSYRKTVHSVMEPLAAGCLTFVGPLHHNNREALEFKALGGVIEARDAKEFSEFLKRALDADSKESDETAITHLLKREIARRSGCSERVVNWCFKAIAP